MRFKKFCTHCLDSCGRCSNEGDCKKQKGISHESVSIGWPTPKERERDRPHAPSHDRSIESVRLMMTADLRDRAIGADISARTDPIDRATWPSPFGAVGRAAACSAFGSATLGVGA